MATVRVIVREARYYEFEFETDEPEEEIQWAENNPECYDPSVGEHLHGWDGIEFVSAEVEDE